MSDTIVNFPEHFKVNCFKEINKNLNYNQFNFSNDINFKLPNNIKNLLQKYCEDINSLNNLKLINICSYLINNKIFSLIIIKLDDNYSIYCDLVFESNYYMISLNKFSIIINNVECDKNYYNNIINKFSFMENYLFIDLK